MSEFGTMTFEEISAFYEKAFTDALEKHCKQISFDNAMTEKNINDQELEFMHRYLNVCEKVTNAKLANELRVFIFDKLYAFFDFVENMEILKKRIDDFGKMGMRNDIDKFVEMWLSQWNESDNQDADATGAEDPETIGAAEAEKGKDMESAQYDEESDGYKYSAAEIAQKLNVLSQYCDIELKDTCTIADIAEFLENVHLDANGNVWLMVQIDEYTFKRFRLNREAAGNITM